VCRVCAFVCVCVQACLVSARGLVHLGYFFKKNLCFFDCGRVLFGSRVSMLGVSVATDSLKRCQRMIGMKHQVTRREIEKTGYCQTVCVLVVTRMVCVTSLSPSPSLSSAPLSLSRSLSRVTFPPPHRFEGGTGATTATREHRIISRLRGVAGWS